MQKIIDGHVHFESSEVFQKQIEALNRDGADKFTVLVMDRFSDTPEAFKQPEAIWIKTQLPERVFFFGGIDWDGWLEGGTELRVPLLDQLNTLKEMGCDGLKLLLGKPNVRRTLNRALDTRSLAPLYQWLEEEQFPVLWHCADPAEFWSRETVPPWARSRGWWYDATYQKKETIDAELERVLINHPKLRLIIPHFYFLSENLSHASTFLDRHPNIFLDLAPGVEWLHNLSNKTDESQNFFVRYQDRIIYGTDLGMMDMATSPERGRFIMDFLSSDRVIAVPEDPFMLPDSRTHVRGICLPPNILAKIFRENYIAFQGYSVPGKLNKSSAKNYLNKLVLQYQGRPLLMANASRVLSELYK